MRTRTWILFAWLGSSVTMSPVIFLGARTAITPLAVCPSARVDLCLNVTFDLDVSVKVRDWFFSKRPW